MNYTIKLNNVKPKDITFSTGTENIIYSKNINEEISGLVSLDINGESIFCEKVTDNHVKAMLSVDGDTFSDTYFKVVRSNKDSLILSKNYTKYKPPGLIKEENEFTEFLRENQYTKVNQRTEKNIESLRKEIYNLKKEINKNKQLVVEKTEPLVQENDSYKTALLNEHLAFIENQKNLVKQSIKTIYTECVDALTEQLSNKEAVLKDNLANRVKLLEKNLLTKYEEEKSKQEAVLTERVDEYSTYIRNFVRETVNTAQDKYDEFFSKKFKEQEQVFLENSITAFNDFKEGLKQEFKKVATGEVHLLFNEKDSQLKNIIQETVDIFTTNLQSKVDAKYNDARLLFDSYVSEVTSKLHQVEERIQDIDSKTNNVITKKEKEIENHVNNFVTTSNERISQIDERFKQADAKISNIVTEIKHSINEVKQYTTTENFQKFIIENSTNELIKIKETLLAEFAAANVEGSEKLIKENNIKIQGIIDNKIKELSDDLDSSIGERIRNNVLFLENSLEPVNEKIKLVESKLENLENIANNVLSEKNKVLEQQINSYVILAEEQQSLIKEKLKDLDKKSQELINERRQAKQNFQQQIDSARMYTDTKVKAAMSEAMLYARKMLDFAGGGGAVAVQFAEGGNIRGPLKIDDLQIDSIDINTTSVSANVIYATNNIYLSGVPLDERFVNEGFDRIDGGLIDF